MVPFLTASCLSPFDPLLVLLTAHLLTIMKVDLQTFLTGLVLAMIPTSVLSIHASDSTHMRRMVVPDNDQCMNALPIDTKTLIVGSTVDATPDDEAFQCGNSYDFDGAGVWYKVTGTGNGLIATTCDAATDHDTQLTVYSYAGDCNNLVCIAGNDDSECGLSSKVLWFSSLGTDYLIHVYGFGGQTGNFGLYVSEFDCNAVLSSAQVVVPCITRIVNDQDDQLDAVALIPEITGLDYQFYNPYAGCTWTGDVLFGSCYAALVQPNVTTEYCITVETVCGPLTGCGQVKVVGACGQKGDKIQVCKVPKGNPKAAKTQCISKKGFSARFDKSLDYIGTCALECPTQTGVQCFFNCYVE